MFFFFPERRLVGHRQEVCGLKWSPDNQYLASGGNDNKLFVWNSSMTQPVHTFTEHLAAVKAIAWSPHHHGLLASGGGTADRCIRFWNTLTGQVRHFNSICLHNWLVWNTFWRKILNFLNLSFYKNVFMQYFVWIL